MELKIIGSSSAGNAYLLDGAKESLLIECGVPFTQVERTVSFAFRKMQGVIISHEHGDHAKSAEKCGKYRIPVYASSGTFDAIGRCGDCRTLHHLEPVNIGGFVVRPFKVVHDANEPFGFLIRHEEMGTMLFATDTAYLPYKFDGINQVMIECNYDKQLLDDNVAIGIVDYQLRNRIVQNHMSLSTCLETLAAIDLSKCRNIVLIHLSDDNSYPDLFRDKVQKQTAITTTIARPGTVVNLNIKPKF